nr:immunoglobulin light chain junction region [Macaca mulatta]
CMQHKALPFSF